MGFVEQTRLLSFWAFSGFSLALLGKERKRFNIIKVNGNRAHLDEEM